MFWFHLQMQYMQVQTKMLKYISYFFNIESKTKRSNCQSYIKYKCEMSVLLEMLYVEIKVLRHL